VNRLFYILFCLILLSCGNKSTKKPEGLLSQSEMVRILSDIHVAEAQIETNVIYPDSALMSFNYWQKEILKRHGVEEETFRKTYRFYQDNLKEMDALYEIIIDTLSVRETKSRAVGNDTTQVEKEEVPPGFIRANDF
jgi:hypothetical protein